MDSSNKEILQRTKMKLRGKSSLYWLGYWWFFSKPKDKTGGDLENKGLHNKRWLLINDYEPSNIDDIPLMKVRTTSPSVVYHHDSDEIVPHIPHPEDCSCRITRKGIDENGYVVDPNQPGKRKPRPLPVYRKLLEEDPICEEPDIEGEPYLGKDFLKKIKSRINNND